MRYERIKNATVRMDRGVFLVRRELQDRRQVAAKDDRQFAVGPGCSVICETSVRRRSAASVFVSSA
ncbi:hypothetical protein [Gluconobacter frateurii]|uniref:hypothetical protein n=1 Tax=Gluconobacter frateurii TaxID=38308 RepID=UPI0038CF61E1